VLLLLEHPIRYLGGAVGGPLELDSTDVPNIEKILTENMDSSRNRLNVETLNIERVQRSVIELLFFASGFAWGSE
jgi:hypothetical protein